MFENFTGASTDVMANAMEGAKLTGYEVVESSHLLYGLVVAHSRTQDFLESRGITAEVVRKHIRTQSARSSQQIDVPFSTTAMKILASAQSIREAMSLKHLYTGHLLLALFDSGEESVLELLGARNDTLIAPSAVSPMVRF